MAKLRSSISENGDSDDHEHVAGGHAENAAEDGGFDASLDPAVKAEQGDTEREAGSRDDADGCIGADDAALRDPADGQTRRQAPQAGADEEVDVQGGADRRPPEDGVAETVADVAHAAQRDEHAQHPAEGAGEGAHDQGVADEAELERIKQEMHGVTPSRAR